MMREILSPLFVAVLTVIILVALLSVLFLNVFGV
jgi:hypothetical protein